MAPTQPLRTSHHAAGRRPWHGDRPPGFPDRLQSPDDWPPGGCARFARYRGTASDHQRRDRSVGRHSHVPVDGDEWVCT